MARPSSPPLAPAAFLFAIYSPLSPVPSAFTHSFATDRKHVLRTPLFAHSYALFEKSDTATFAESNASALLRKTTGGQAYLPSRNLKSSFRFCRLAGAK